MAIRGQILGRHGNWLCILPVDGLVLTKAVNREFRVNHITFVAKDKLPRIRRRLGMPCPVSYYREHSFGRKLFDAAPTFAVYREMGRPGKLRVEALRTLKRELALLSLSQLGYNKRRFGAYPRLGGEAAVSKLSDAFLNTRDKSYVIGGRLVGKHQTLVLDVGWQRWQRQVFFRALIKMLFGAQRMAGGWRDDLERAAVLAGQSQSTDTVPQAFLWNMIALELLLTRQGDKYREVLPSRLEAFLGWVGYWKVRKYEQRIRDVYKKRCALVHAGRLDLVTVRDLLFSDDLLLNLFNNIVRHRSLFRTKSDVLLFAERVQAEHVLGMNSRVRPRTLRFISRRYSKADLAEL